MFPILVSPDITAFVGAQRSGEFFEGLADMFQGPNSLPQQLVCIGVRDTEGEALHDPERDAAALIELWRQQVNIPGSRGR